MEPDKNNNHSSSWCSFFKESAEHVVTHAVGHAVAGHIGGAVAAGLTHTASVNEGENEWVVNQHMQQNNINLQDGLKATIQNNGAAKPGK